jgi:hypothetical protein
MTKEEIQKSMEEFYNFIYSENVRDFETSVEYKELIEQMKEALEIMSEKTSGFSDISIEKILEIINSENINKIILLFRILTAVSRMNMETYFVSDLCGSGVFIPKIKIKNGNPIEREIEFGAEIIPMPKYSKLIDLAKNEQKILEEMINFFEKYDLIKKLQSLQGKEIKEIIELSKTLLKYSEKGAGAEKSGEEAENIIKNKLELWGLKENIDYNKNDEKLTEILERKIEFLKNRGALTEEERKEKIEKIKKERKSRQFDLVFPANNSNKEPKVIAQIVFYTSNTGSEGKKKTNQNINTSNYIKEILPVHSKEITNLLVLDGPGWIQMAGDFQKNNYLSENFVQIKTIDTKLKRILNERGLVYPIDVEIAILEIKLKDESPTKEKILKLMANKDNITADKNEIISQNHQFFDGKTDRDVIELLENRHKIAKKFLILEKLQEIAPTKNPQKYNVIIPSKTNSKISDTDIFSEISKIRFDEEEIQRIIDELKNEGTIIIQYV